MANNDDDIEKCLTSLGIEKRRIIPTNITQKILRQRPELNQFCNEINIFPLDWFDNGSDSRFSADCREGKLVVQYESTQFCAFSLLRCRLDSIFLFVFPQGLHFCLIHQRMDLLRSMEMILNGVK